MAKKIQLTSDRNKPLLIKNPIDFSNFIFIKKAFPYAKFIFIHRHPLRILNSTRIAGRTLYYDKSPYYELIDRDYKRILNNPLLRFMKKRYYSKSSYLGVFIDTRNIIKGVNYFYNNINNISKDDYINIKYEDLCKNPNNVIDKTMKFLSLKIKDIIDYKTQTSPRNFPIEENTKKMQNKIYKSTKNYFELFNYKEDKFL